MLCLMILFNTAIILSYKNILYLKKKMVKLYKRFLIEYVKQLTFP